MWKARVQQKNDTLYVVNFWATWCKPCVEELPHFQKAAEAFSSQPVKIILSSLDTRARMTQVGDFIKKNNYTSETLLFAAGNPNVWIDKIEPKWDGAIPANLMYKNGKKVYFIESDFEKFDQLKEAIQSKLK